MEWDPENLTYNYTEELLYSAPVLRFHGEKYGPKIDWLARRLGDRFAAALILDVGVGYGAFLHILEENHGLKRLFGMDPFPKSIEIARRHTSARIEVGDVRRPEWPFEPGTFDVITCFEVVEHLEAPEVFFDHVKRYIAPGGFVVVTTPNRDLPYLMRRLPLVGIKDTDRSHINVRPSSAWKRLARERGFEIAASWKGEHLTHVRGISKALRVACRAFRIDHRRIPIVNAFEQSFCMILEPPRSGAPK